MDGYTRLAALMGRQKEYNIFRRYMPLRALRLLHLSAEISYLSGNLGYIVDMDRASDDAERALFESYYQAMHDSKEQPQKSMQMEAWTALSAKLREYGEELLLFRRLSQLPDVNRMHLENFRAWLREDSGGHRFLHGTEAVLWDADFEHDLTSLCIPAERQDLITRFVYRFVLPLYHRTTGQKRKSSTTVSDPFNGDKQSTPVFEYSDKVIVGAVNLFSAGIASLIPSISALALYFIHSALGRLGAIIAFTFLFSMILCLITNVRKAECFGITAAFSAVLVVFVGGNDSIGCNCSA